MAAFYDGPHAKEAHKSKARDILAKSHFTHESQKFTLKDYCSRHTRAQYILHECGDITSGESQVYLFLSNINGYENLKLQVLSDPDGASQDLLKAISKFQGLFHCLKEAGHGSQGTGGRHSIGAQFSRGGRRRGGNHDGHDSRGRGCGCGGHGGHNHHGGRGDNMYIDPSVLSNLSSEHCRWLIAGRDQTRNEQNSWNNTGHTTSNNHTIGAANQDPSIHEADPPTKYQLVIYQQQPPPPPQPQPQQQGQGNSPSGQMGNQNRHCNIGMYITSNQCHIGATSKSIPFTYVESKDFSACT